jgi:hypothetical protein
MSLFAALAGLSRVGPELPTLFAGAEKSAEVSVNQTSDEVEFLRVINGRRSRNCPGQPLTFNSRLNQATSAQTRGIVKDLTLADTQRLGLGYDSSAATAFQLITSLASMTTLAD